MNRRQRWILILALTLVTIVAGVVVLFSSIGPTKNLNKRAIAQLPRGFYAVPAASGGSISYLHAGDPNGRRVIFVHGTPGDAEDWGNYLLQVPPGFEYIAIDRPGFGKSGPATSVSSLAAQAAAIEPLLVQRNGSWPLLAGHSLGGPIVVRVAADYPEKVGGLLILAGALDPKMEKIHPLQTVGAWTPVRGLLPRVIRNSNEELIPLKGELQLLETKLGQVMCPIEILHGTKDSLVPYDNVAFMRAQFRGNPAVTVSTLQGVDHFLPWSNELDIRRLLARLADETTK